MTDILIWIPAQVASVTDDLEHRFTNKIKKKISSVKYVDT